MKTFVRIGGLTTAEAVAAVPDGGAAGFVYEVPGTPRSLTGPQITPLIEGLNPGAEAWAQVLDPTAETIHRLFDEVGVDRIEVHGRVPEGLEFLEIHHLIPSLSLPPPGAEGPMPAIPPAEDFPRLHLDAGGSPLLDGHAVQPNWETAQRIVDGQPGRKLTLSGGLTPENVGAAIEAVRPWGVGVCAGVERAPGQLDLDRLRSFLEAVTAAER